MTDSHNASVTLVNQTESTLGWLTVAHKNGDYRSCQVWNNVPPGFAEPAMPFTFTTGDGSPNDYWYITFAIGDAFFTCGSQRCNWTKDDVDGGKSFIRISRDKVEWVPPVSSNVTAGTSQEP